MQLKSKAIMFLSLVLGIFLISPSYANGEIKYCQGMVCSTTPPTPQNDPTAAFAVVDENNKVINTIVGNLNHFGNNDQTTSDHPGCSLGCKIILQAPSDPGSFNVSGGFTSNGSTEVIHNPTSNIFEVKENGVLTQTIAVPEINNTESGTVVTTLSVEFGQITDSGTVSANISGKEIINNSENLVTENNVFFEKSETEQVVRNITSSLRLLHSRIERILNLLNGWML